MALRREEIVDFKAKMEGLQHLLGLKNNFERFCEAIGLKRDGLKACLTDNGTRGLSTDYQKLMQEALSGRLGNFLSWPEWIETDRGRIVNGQRRDSSASFLQRCREAIAGTSKASVPLRLAIVDNPAPIVESLGSVELFATAQFVEGCNGTLSSTLICRPANLENARIAIRFCKLRFKRTPALTDAPRRVRPNAFAPLKNDKDMEVTVHWVGTSQLPTVEVAARGAIEMINLPDDLWSVPEAKAGDRYEAQLIVYLRDCRLIDKDDDGGVELEEISPAEGNSFIGPGSKKMEHILKLIEARMAQLNTLDLEDGYGVLHSFAVALVSAHPIADENESNGKLT